MGKPRGNTSSNSSRKSRLSKINAPTEFTGFSAFAATSPPITTTANTTTANTTTDLKNISANNTHPSPIYLGSDPTLQSLFRKIGQKRDSYTKKQALIELRSTLFSEEVPKNKKELASSLSHLIFLFQTKLAYDNDRHVRLETLKTLAPFPTIIPKAWNSILLSLHTTTDKACGGSTILGMIYCLSCDPVKEISAQANTILESFENYDVFAENLVEHFKSTLELTRPAHLAGVYYGTNKKSSDEFSEKEKEDAEERFERVLVMTLLALNNFFQNYKCEGEKEEDIWFDESIMFRFITTSRGSFRRLSYKLITTISHHCPNLLTDSHETTKLPNILITSLESEKDPSNINMLFEAFLSYLYCLPKDVKTILFSENYKARLTKCLKKIFRKGCYNCPATVWGSSVFPLLLSFLELLSHESTKLDKVCDVFLGPLWEASKNATTSQDAACIISANVECCSYLLLLPSKDQESKATIENCEVIGNKIAAHYANCFEHYLIAEKLQIHGLGTILAKSLLKLDQMQDQQDKQLLFHAIQDSFWVYETREEGKRDHSIRKILLDCAVKQPTIFSKRFLFLLQTIMDTQKNKILTDSATPTYCITTDTTSHQLTPLSKSSHFGKILCELFHQSLLFRQNPENAQLLLHLIEVCGIPQLFSPSFSDMDEERFCLNELLMWIVARGHLYSTNTTDLIVKNALTAYFTILRHCLCSWESYHLKQIKVWETVLKELIASNCSLSTIVLGLEVIGQIGQGEDIVKSKVLDDFCNGVGLSVLARMHGIQDGEELKYYYPDEEIRLFLQFCVGLGSSHLVIISKRIISVWAGACTTWLSSPDYAQVNPLSDEEFDNITLQSLLKLLSVSSSMEISPQSTHNIILTAWYQGGKAWCKDAIPLLVLRREERDAFLSSASQILCKDLLKSSCDKDPLWKSRVGRLISLSYHTHGIKKYLTSCLKSLGLDDLLLWRKSKNTLFDYLMDLLSFLNEEDARYLFQIDDQQANQGDVHLLTTILVSISKSSSPCSLERIITPLPPSEQLAPKERCDLLFDIILAKTNQNETNAFLESCVGENLSMLKLSMKLIQDEKTDTQVELITMRKGLNLLSNIIAMLLPNRKAYEREENDNVEQLANTRRSNTAEDNQDDIDAQNIKVGDILWHTPQDDWHTQQEDNSKLSIQNSPRLAAKIIKIHTDDFPNLYFTIQIQDSGNIPMKEKQTVPNRMKRLQYAPKRTMLADQSLVTLSKEYLLTYGNKAKLLETNIMEKCVRPFMTELSKKKTCYTEEEIALGDSLFDCLNIIISQCQLTGKLGLGSLRYEVFQILNQLERNVVQSINNMVSFKEISKEGRDDHMTGAAAAARDIHLFSISMGLGNSTRNPSVISNFDILRLDPLTMVESLCSLYADTEWLSSQGDNVPAVMQSFHSSVLSFLLVVSWTEIKSSILSRVINILNEISRKILVIQEDTVKNGSLADDLVTNCFLVMGIIGNIQTKQYAYIDTSYDDSRAELTALSDLTRCFIHMSSDKHQEAADDYMYELPPMETWNGAFTSLLRRCKHRDEIKCISNGSRALSDELCHNLFLPNKQWCSYQLLHLLAKNYEQHTEEDRTKNMHHNTQVRFNSWKKGMLEEEAEELEEDVIMAAKWLPHSLMDEIESWIEADHHGEHEESDFHIMGRLLSWLACLDFLDNAAKVNVINRNAISSYIEMTHAMDIVLGLALQLASLEMPYEKWSDCLCLDINEMGDEAIIEGHEMFYAKVATLVVFRSVETLPTIAKSWWNDMCPRSFKSRFNSFVQYQVAPETLRVQLGTISTTDFGEMSVTGSCVSREVMATYVQDECKLSVTIRIPPSFPLRNVEVDCKKTLGIAEKRWRRWALQIMRMLNSQDGSILEALLLWKDNVDKEFEGVEPCPVCYSVLCVKTHAMPNLTCSTCKNKFHSSCLYKWFHSSGKSQCVLCQQPWSGARV